MNLGVNTTLKIQNYRNSNKTYSTTLIFVMLFCQSSVYVVSNTEQRLFLSKTHNCSNWKILFFIFGQIHNLKNFDQYNNDYNVNWYQYRFI